MVASHRPVRRHGRCREPHPVRRSRLGRFFLVMTGPIVIAARARNRHGRAFEIVMAALSRTSWPGSCYRHGRDLAIVMVGIALFAMVGISLFAIAARSQPS